MDDLISRQDAIDLVRDVCDAILSGCGCHYDSGVGDEVYDDIHEVSTILKCNKAIRKSLMDLPSAQPDIIRCKECKHLFEDKCPLRTWWTHTEDDFCSYAKRRTGETNEAD